MKRLQFRLMTSALVAVSLTAQAVLMGLPTPAAAAVPAPNGNCADILFVGARGSGNPGPGTPGWIATSEDPHGLGSVVGEVLDRFYEGLSQRRSVEVASTEFAALDAVSLTRPDLLGQTDDFFNGIHDGINWTTHMLKAKAETCPRQRVVLAGYSQGAMVMHRVIERLQTVDGGLKVLDRMDAAILVADGDRVRKDGAKRFGGRLVGAGIGHGVHLMNVAASPTDKFPRLWRDKILQVCKPLDPVCDWTNSVGQAALFPIHTTYGGSAELIDATAAATEMVLAVPLPVPSEVRFEPKVATDFRRQLHASVAEGYSLEWKVDRTSSLPARFKLSKSGVITGRTSTLPTGETTVKVRSKRSKTKPSSWAFATIKWGPAPVTTTGSRLVAWGENGSGQLGSGSTSSSTSPIPIDKAPLFISVVSSSRQSPGAAFTLGLTADGEVYSWGSGDDGELGRFAVQSLVPEKIDGLANVKALAAGGNTAYALLADGKVMAWGSGSQGQLGDGRVERDHKSSRPVVVQNLDDATSIGASSATAYAVRSDGSVWAWGWGYRGALGDGRPSSGSCAAAVCTGFPVKVWNVSDAVQVVGSSQNAYALSKDGTVWAWGNSNYGALGGSSGDLADALIARQVSGITTAIALAANPSGVSGAMALLSDGSVKAWGYGAYGELGDGKWKEQPPHFSTKPVTVQGLPPVTAIAAGGNVRYALDASGRVWSWGYNYGGALGVGKTSRELGLRATPGLVPELEGVTSIAGGYANGFALVPPTE